MNPTALIAEDEPLLAKALRAELQQAWPELQVAGMVGDGLSAVSEALRLLPQVLFFDIRMPGQDGLAAASELADAWPIARAPMPQLVFVTAYDEYALRAFDARALDYVLKPVQAERLARTVARLKDALAAQAPAAQAPAGAQASEDTLAQWRQLLAAASGSLGSAEPAGAPLRFISASEPGSAGQAIRMVPIEQVDYFEAADKYVRVLTTDGELLIRTPLRQLIGQLDATLFWQVHRGVVVRADRIERVLRDDAGRLTLLLRGRTDRIAVSRLFAHLFRAM